jgi:nicotinamidase-related amidase
MALSQLDEICALVVIDMQKGIVAMPTVHPIESILARNGELTSSFRERGLPVVLVNVSGGPPGRTDTGKPKREITPDWAELVPQLGQSASDRMVTKQCWGAFSRTDLDDFLQEAGVTQILLTGIATSLGVESTARSAYDLGYNVVLVTDAMSDREMKSHQNSVENVFPRLGETCSTADVLGLLEKRANL